jgi:anti-anti-sigma factor
MLMTYATQVAWTVGARLTGRPPDPSEEGPTMADFGITATGSSTFALTGELDLATVPLVDVAIGDSVAQGGSILLNIIDVTFADSSGIGAIVRSANALSPGCLVLHGVHDRVGRVIDVMGVERAVPNLHVIECTGEERPPPD